MAFWARIGAVYLFFLIFYAMTLAGILQMVFGFFRLGRVLRFVPHSAMVGYVNAMGIIISLAQIKYFKIPGEGINILKSLVKVLMWKVVMGVFTSTILISSKFFMRERHGWIFRQL